MTQDRDHDEIARNILERAGVVPPDEDDKIEFTRELFDFREVAKFLAGGESTENVWEGSSAIVIKTTSLDSRYFSFREDERHKGFVWIEFFQSEELPEEIEEGDVRRFTLSEVASCSEWVLKLESVVNVRFTEYRKSKRRIVRVDRKGNQALNFVSWGKIWTTLFH